MDNISLKQRLETLEQKSASIKEKLWTLPQKQQNLMIYGLIGYMAIKVLYGHEPEKEHAEYFFQVLEKLIDDRNAEDGKEK